MAVADGRGRGVLRSQMVVIHALLLAVAVGVVWTTVGSNPNSVVSASATDRVADAEPAAPQTHTPQSDEADLGPAPRLSEGPDRVREQILLHQQNAEPVTPHAATTTSANPRQTPAPVRPTPSPSLTPPAPTHTDKPMLALPEPGRTWPATLPANPTNAPYYALGGMYGTPGAGRIVYLLDASGSLIDTLPFIQQELQRSLGQLQPDQSFAVLFFAGHRVVEVPPVGMKKATHAAVQLSSQWVDPTSGKIIASGPPTPDAAIRRALAYQPDAVILLSDGLTPGEGDSALTERARLLSLIDTANTTGVTFHTLQVRQPDALAGPTRRGTLEMIALQTGGIHRYIAEDDLVPR